MKTLGLALASSIIAVPALYSVLTKLVIEDKGAAAQLAAAIIAAVPFLREFLEKSRLLQWNAQRPPVLPPGDFGFPPGRMILYGSLIVIGTNLLGGGLTALLAGELGKSSGDVKTFIVVSGFTSALIFWSIGRWVGRRCASHDIVVLVVIGCVVLLGEIFSEIWITAYSRDPDMPQPSLTLSAAAASAYFVLLGSIGYWRGRRQRLSAYLNYLLQSVSEDTRRAIVDIAFEEARGQTHTRQPVARQSVSSRPPPEGSR